MELQTETKILEEKAGFAKIVIEPLNPGFGHTVGYALRRVLLSSLTGAAITSIKIAGVSHEFSTLPGVKEDMVDFILNLKKIDFRMDSRKPLIATINAQGVSELTAKDVKCPTGLKFVNPDLYLATLSDKKARLECEITVEYGRGYQPSVEQAGAVGELLVDANFSPVKRVNYTVENTRVGRVTNLDRLIIEIWSKESTQPLEILKQAAAILAEEFQKIQGETKVIKLGTEKEETEGGVKGPVVTPKVYLEEINLPARIVNSLKKGGIESVEDVKKAGEKGLAKIKNIGPKTIKLVLNKVSQPEKNQ